MVFLAITPIGLQQALRMSHVEVTHIWCGANCLPQVKFDEVEFDQGSYQSLTRLDYELSQADKAALADALDSIAEHHPGEIVWIEG